MADFVLASLRQVRCDEKILAVDHASAGELGPVAERAGFHLVCGPKDDVLARFALALERFPCDYLVRATGDNPFVSAFCANALVERARGFGGDYLAFDGLPLGMGVEVARSESLLAAARDAVDPYEREHVMPYLYRHPECFSVSRISPPDGYGLSGSRVTVDTAEDYERAKSIVRVLGARAGELALVEALREGRFDA
jgi:spore coat polysaccharide biosynthesis protein SpsF